MAHRHAAGTEARPTTGQAELRENKSVPKCNLGTRGTIVGRASPPAKSTGWKACATRRRRPQAAL